MKIHHLNCGTMRPLVVGRLVCHVLACETPAGLVLVDTGFGLASLADPSTRLGPVRRLLRLVQDPSETAVRQLEALGFAREDVRHVVLTHFDFDHIGGLADFPDATVHTTATELAAAEHPPTFAERRRYLSVLWDHSPTWRTYDPAGGDGWHGLQGVHPLDGVDGIALLPMPGHTRGHAAVAVDAGDGRILLHAGDAAFHRSTVAGPRTPVEDRAPNRFLLGYEKLMAVDRAQVEANHARLAELAATDGVEIVNSHDPVIFDRAVRAS
jgi:glyoxylase-like metal-dependent hydrolase (beta-lactamase superfamily II)